MGAPPAAHPPLRILLGVALLLASSARAQLTRRAEGDLLRVHNPGEASVVALRVGDTIIDRLGPGESRRVRAAPDAVIAGRFALETWAVALEDTSQGWADLHLRTAGHFLDAAEGGPDGEPARAANLRALNEVAPQVAARWVGGGARRLSLAARAARHVPPGPLLEGLLRTISPQDARIGLPALGPLNELLRDALEGHGAAALPSLRGSPAWLRDRGCEEPALRDAPAEPGSVDRLAQALDAGDVPHAAREAARLIAGRVALPETTMRIACAALELAAREARVAGRLLSSERHLLLMTRACPRDLPYRLRVAELHRARGNAALARADLVTAVGLYRAAWWIADDAADRARLADTLADLAALRYAREELALGNAWLDAARRVDPFRPRVLEVGDLRRGPDPRARGAILVVALLLGVFAFRRIRRMWAPRRR